VLQGYGDGSVVEWTGEPDSEEPAAYVEVASSGEMGSSHAEDEDLPETGGASPSLLLAGALTLVAAAAAVARASVR
jgi:LPXTG-motif cell wall-anchored protein